MSNCFAVLRSKSEKKILDTVKIMMNSSEVELAEEPKELEPRVADNILIDVMDTELKNNCSLAGAVKLDTPPGEVINMVTNSKPPAHVIVVSERYDSYRKLNHEFNELDPLCTEEQLFSNENSLQASPY